MTLADALDLHRRAVAEDAALADDRHAAWLRAVSALTECATDTYAYAYAYAYADADAYADAYADADADADAYAYAYVNATADASAEKKPPPPTTGANHMRNGLYLLTTPSGGSVAVLRVGWLRRVEGDEYELVGARTPLRGEYTVTFDQAQDAPPPSWKWTEPLKRPLQLHRFQIRAPVELDPAGYAKLFPRVSP